MQQGMTQMKKWLPHPGSALAITLLGMTASTSALAEVVRCQGQLVDESMNESELLALCGPPDSKNLQDGIAWTYKGGNPYLDSQLDVVIRFYNNGDILEIDTQPR